nr:hypothetical protein [Streptomyces sp. alain-838]
MIRPAEKLSVLRFGAKAETLSRLMPRLRKAQVLSLVYFTVDE